MVLGAEKDDDKDGQRKLVVERKRRNGNPGSLNILQGSAGQSAKPFTPMHGFLPRGEFCDMKDVPNAATSYIIVGECLWRSVGGKVCFQVRTKCSVCGNLAGHESGHGADEPRLYGSSQPC